jgi:hypothetical protein
VDDQATDRAFAVVHDVAASWADYDLVRAALPATGTDLVLHAAGPTDEGFRTIDVWCSEAAWHHHRPQLDRAFGHLTSPPVVRALHVDHLVAAPNPPGTSLPRNPRSHR